MDNHGHLLCGMCGWGCWRRATFYTYAVTMVMLLKHCFPVHSIINIGTAAFMHSWCGTRQLFHNFVSCWRFPLQTLNVPCGAKMSWPCVLPQKATFKQVLVYLAGAVSATRTFKAISCMAKHEMWRPDTCMQKAPFLRKPGGGLHRGLSRHLVPFRWLRVRIPCARHKRNCACQV